ncbi:MAG: hypothetical protein WCJ30_01280, partial [Deltaproteobacteria bacterium]
GATLDPAAPAQPVTTIGGVTRVQFVSPVRLFDTRTDAASSALIRSDGAAGGPLTATRSGTCNPLSAAPSGTTGVWLNAAAAPQAETGFLSVAPSGVAASTSTLNYAPPAARANAVPVALGAVGGVTFTASSTVDVIADLTAAFSSTGLGLLAIEPRRVMDTRAYSGLAGGTRLAIDVHAPPAARGVVASVAVISRSVGGFVTAFSCDGAAPASSNINFGPSSVVANTVMSAVSGGELCFQSSTDVDLIVDVTGYLVEAGELSYQPLVPVRLLDTRQPGSRYVGRLGEGQTIEVPIQSLPGMPSGVMAAFVNLTSISPSTRGFIALHPCGSPMVTTSSLNLSPDQPVAALALSALAGGSLCVTSASRTHLVVDLLGVWVPTPGAPPPTGIPGTTTPPDSEDTDVIDPTAADAGTADSAARDGGPPAASGPGCSCSVTASTAAPRFGTGAALSVVAWAVLAQRRRRRRVRPGARSDQPGR